MGYDSELRNYLVHGFTHGFTIGCLDLPVQLDMNMCNLISADDYAYIIDKKVAKELLLGQVLVMSFPLAVITGSLPWVSSLRRTQGNFV